MKIIIDYTENEFENLKIESAEYLKNYSIKIRFNNGKENNIDFKPFLSKSNHRSIRKYLDEKLLAQYQIVNGNLCWDDYELIFPIWDLYNGTI